MRIPCPWCGPRPLAEFTYGGDAAKRRPEGPGEADLGRWTDFGYWRDNPAGRHLEFWHHGGGCRSWLIVARDTTTHEIEAVHFAGPGWKGRR